MLELALVILIVCWLLGLTVIHITGPINLLLIIILVIIIYRMLINRNL